jgi:lysophospholipid acyltransferase (LPLAT)-like uncharacterized protein
MLKRFGKHPRMQAMLGQLLAYYLLFVRKTSRVVDTGEDPLARLDEHAPFIATFWHGEHFMASFGKGHFHFTTLISRHGDGEINAVAASYLGIETIRGSGNPKRIGKDKGGAAAFRSMMKVLKSGNCVASTADIPKIARVAGAGLILLAQRSGRPIVPMAYVTSRRIRLNSWDRASINLPFSRIGFVTGKPLYIDSDLDEDALEKHRLALQDALNAVTERAYALAEGR